MLNYQRVFSPIVGIMIRSDELIFFRGVALKPPTSIGSVMKKVPLHHENTWKMPFPPTNLFVSRTVVYSSQAVQKKQLVFFMMCFFADLEGNISRKPRDFFPQMRLPCLAINPKTCKSCPGIRHWLLAWCQNTLAMDFPIVFFHG